MPGGEALGAEFECMVHQEPPADRAVAGQARVGSPAAGIFRDHRRDDLAAEKLAGVENVEGDFQLFGDTAGKRDGVRGAAAVFEFGLRVGPQAKHHPGNIVALLAQECGRGGGIHAAAHRDDDFGEF